MLESSQYSVGRKLGATLNSSQKKNHAEFWLLTSDYSTLSCRYKVEGSYYGG